MYNQNVFVFFSNQQKEIVSQSEGDQKVPRHSGALKTHKEPTHITTKNILEVISCFIMSLWLLQHNLLTLLLRLYLCCTFTISAMTLNTLLGN